MDLLARREHSRLELRRKLGGRFDHAELEAAIELLAEENLQSDARFAFSYTRERMLRGFGPLRIENDLKQRGVADDSISAALAEVPREEGLSWLEVAAAALVRRFGVQPTSTSERTLEGTLAGTSEGALAGTSEGTFEEKARRIRYLRYRGFTEMPAGLGPLD